MKVRIKKRVVEVNEKLGKALVGEGVAREVKKSGVRPKVSGILMREYAVNKSAATAEKATTEQVKVDVVDKVDTAAPPPEVDGESEKAEAEATPKRRKRASEVDG